MSGIFSGLLAYAFDTVSGAGGLSGWQWYHTNISYSRIQLIILFQVIPHRRYCDRHFWCCHLVPAPGLYVYPLALTHIAKLKLMQKKSNTVPETAKWLTEKEKIFIQARLPSNSPRANEQNFNLREIIDSLKDIRLWLFTFIWATFTVGTNGVTFYQSTVIADLGYT